MNSIIEMVEKKIKPKPQFINEKISKFLNFKKKKKTELSKDRITQKFGRMDSLVSNFMLDSKFWFLLKNIDYMEQSTKQKP